MLDDTFLNIVFQFQIAILAICTRLLTIPALAVSLCALALLLFAIIILFALHWHTQAMILKQKIKEAAMASLGVETPIYENFQLSTYHKLISTDVSDDDFDSSDRDYVNV